jgi:hypothetical protein
MTEHALPRRAPATAVVHPPATQAFHILHWGYAILPILAGLDKFANLLTDWTRYLAPQVTQVIPAQTFMYVVGAIEVVAGILVALRPSIGGYVVGFWLWGIIANLVLRGGYWDVALRDFGLSLGALALARLALEFDPELRRRP